MKDAIETLVAEHDVILRVLDAMERYVPLIRDGSASPDTVAEFVTFARDFADKHHHAKEEDLLFQAMCEFGFTRDGGPIACMLHEHEEGREQIGILAGASARAKAAQGTWSDEDRLLASRAARQFIEGLRLHIQKENQVLYPMARVRLPGPAMLRVDQACDEVQTRAMSTGVLDQLNRLASTLCA